MSLKNSNSILESFSTELCSKCQKKYGMILSAENFCRNYNLRANEIDSISRESARKWLRGLSFPEPAKLMVLVEWLDIDLNSVLARH